MNYAFDTNAIIHLMRGLPSIVKNREQALKTGARFYIPPVVNYEILRGLIIKPTPAHEKAYNIIRHNCVVGEMTGLIWERAAVIYAQLYADHFSVADADILIAAFCVVNRYRLVTANIKDFENINELQVED